MKKKYCCEALNEILTENRAHINYFPKYREYYIDRKCDPTGAYDISHCPWCGTKLPESLRDQWFDILEKEYGLDDPWSLGQEKLVPKEFTTDEWWKQRGL